MGWGESCGSGKQWTRKKGIHKLIYCSSSCLICSSISLGFRYAGCLIPLQWITAISLGCQITLKRDFFFSFVLRLFLQLVGLLINYGMKMKDGKNKPAICINVYSFFFFPNTGLEQEQLVLCSRQMCFVSAHLVALLLQLSWFHWWPGCFHQQTNGTLSQTEVCLEGLSGRHEKCPANYHSHGASETSGWSSGINVSGLRLCTEPKVRCRMIKQQTLTLTNVGIWHPLTTCFF